MEGADTIVAAVFYMLVVQAVILFDSESWFLYTAADKMRKGHTPGYCKKPMGNQARGMEGRMLVTLA